VFFSVSEKRDWIFCKKIDYIELRNQYFMTDLKRIPVFNFNWKTVYSLSRIKVDSDLKRIPVFNFNWKTVYSLSRIKVDSDLKRIPVFNFNWISGRRFTA